MTLLLLHDNLSGITEVNSLRPTIEQWGDLIDRTVADIDTQSRPISELIKSYTTSSRLLRTTVTAKLPQGSAARMGVSTSVGVSRKELSDDGTSQDL